MNNMFKVEEPLEKIYDDLLKHLKEGSSVSIGGDKSIYFRIPENGENSWWFDDLIKVVARKIANGDAEMVEFCIKNNIDLFDISLKKSIKP